jgi:hypothetical protein
LKSNFARRFRLEIAHVRKTTILRGVGTSRTGSET